MKNLIIFSVLMSFLFSCTKDDEFEMEQYPQKWQLVKMTGQIPNSETTGKNMFWQEFYLFNANGTFKKSREQGGETNEASGIFTFKDFSDGKYLILTYPTPNNLIGTCTPPDLTEVLRIESNSRLFSTWFACDGPGLEYKRTE